MRFDPIKSKVLRGWTYFRRGHNVYMIFAISFLNFLVIQWRLLIEQIEVLEAIFRNLFVFTILFFVTYVPLSTLVGWIDYKRGAVPVDQMVAAEANPWVQDLAKAVLMLAEGKKEEVVEIMKKWAGE